MITLPLVNTTSDIDSGLSAAASGVGEKGLSDDFLNLFSKALPGQVTLADGKTLSLSAALNKVAGKNISAQDEAAGKTPLAALLNELNLDKPEALSALLANVGKATEQDKTAQTDTGKEAAHDLSSADMQALSALFAMLPQPNTATPAATLTTATSPETDETASLSALLTGSGMQQKTTQGRADDRLNAAGKTQPADTTFAAKSVGQAAGQTQLAANDNALPVVAVDKDSRDNAISNNTTPTLSMPTISSATVSTPVSTHIATPVAPQISAQLGSQEWQQAVSQHVTLFTRQGQQSAELRLHPEDLGQIQISLKLDDNQAQLQMTSPHSHVRAALEATLPALRTALAESGIQLGQSNISSESFAQQQQQSGQQQQQSQRSAGAFPSLGGEAESLAVPASVQRLASGNNAVDIFA
ncbi:flagellar hook-length control protein FliK [Enterobacteriaceae bacterium H20N1]|uniref:Flagellar hook-length control protein FliK n=1 Tax=Dryocola boscaweniae TaxID=2925397 RepID=A0A9X2W6U2_9ENTR|nr:flagellar hook-length control protein FliK [Dryocola boscaweniae]MCT4702173.1 flagellar hook-length control protein FliK [Dryocola boscaweniae]MCT4719383.1 flagellar hook-length control protein FliK [Dryocola boscaweniae]